MAKMTYDTGANVRVVIESCHGDLQIDGGDRTQVELHGDRTLVGRVREGEGVLTISGYHGDLEIQLGAQATVEVGRVSGDVDVTNVAQAIFRSVGGDITASQIGAFNAGDAGGDVNVSLNNGPAEIGRVGGDLEVDHASSLEVGIVGGDAELSDIQELRSLGRIGGDLEVQWSGTLRADTPASVGGDASIKISSAANFRLRAVVGGDISGEGDAPEAVAADEEEDEAPEVESDGHGWQISAAGGELVGTFGEGGPEFHLSVGGDLELHGGTMSDSTFSGTSESDFGIDDFAGIGEEMRRFGREMKSMGRQLAREVAREVRNSTRTATPGARPRVHVQFNDKTFHFDEEQIDRLTQQAREAAANGVLRAQEAVERALVNMVSSRRQAGPPRPPAPPAVGQTVRIERETPVAVASRSPEETTTDKLAILRMVSEGRLAIDEAEAMLRALEERG